MIRLQFEIGNAADASKAAAVCVALAATLGQNDGENMALAPAPAAAGAAKPGRPRKSDLKSTTAADVVAQYNSIAADTGAAPVVQETPEVETAPAAVAPEPELVEPDPVSEQATTPEVEAPAAAAPSMNRDEMILATKTLAMSLGIVWVKQHITTALGGAKLSDLTDDQLTALHTQATKDAAARG